MFHKMLSVLYAEHTRTLHIGGLMLMAVCVPPVHWHARVRWVDAKMFAACVCVCSAKEHALAPPNSSYPCAICCRHQGLASATAAAFVDGRALVCTCVACRVCVCATTSLSTFAELLARAHARQRPVSCKQAGLDVWFVISEHGACARRQGGTILRQKRNLIDVHEFRNLFRRLYDIDAQGGVAARVHIV